MATDRLNTPAGRDKRRLPRLNISGDSFGNFAEAFARFMGTARFIGYMTVFVVLWVIVNVVGLFGLRWDPYPFILLNLFFSTQASYAAPLILLAQNRQEARDRVGLEHDRRQAAQSRADMDFLAREIASLRMSVGDLATRDYLRSELRSELRMILAELDDGPDSAADRSGPDRSAADRSGADRSGPGRSRRAEPAGTESAQ